MRIEEMLEAAASDGCWKKKPRTLVLLALQEINRLAEARGANSRELDHRLAQMSDQQATISRLEREVEAAGELLTNGRLIEWGWNSVLAKHGYYLRGDWAGTTMRDVISKAAEQQKEGE